MYGKRVIVYGSVECCDRNHTQLYEFLQGLIIAYRWLFVNQMVRQLLEFFRQEIDH